MERAEKSLDQTDQKLMSAVGGAAQRAVGKLSLTARAPARLETVRQEGAYRALFPTRWDQTLEAVLLNTAGGIAAGDRFRISAHAKTGASLTLTTQAAERIYGASVKAPAREIANQVSTLKVDDNASLFWLPQETILFDRASFERRLQVTVSTTSRFLMVEPVVFGRGASGEKINSLHFRDRIEITCDGKPIYLDALRLRGDISHALSHTAIGAGATSMANLIFAHRDAAHHLDAVRTLLPHSAGASLLDDTLLVIRLLAEDSFTMRKSLVPVLERLSDNSLPKSWRL